MIQFLVNQLKATKGKLPVTFRPKGGKWFKGVLLAADQHGMVVVTGKGQVTVMPWGNVGAINIGAGQQAAGAGQGEAAKGEAAKDDKAKKAAAKPAAKNGKDSKAAK